MTILARAHTACAVALITGAAMFATAATAQQSRLGVREMFSYNIQIKW